MSQSEQGKSNFIPTDEFQRRRELYDFQRSGRKFLEELLGREIPPWLSSLLPKKFPLAELTLVLESLGRRDHNGDIRAFVFDQVLDLPEMTLCLYDEGDRKMLEIFRGDYHGLPPARAVLELRAYPENWQVNGAPWLSPGMDYDGGPDGLRDRLQSRGIGCSKTVYMSTPPRVLGY